MLDEEVQYRGMLQAYATLFSGPIGNQVLDDLSRSCFIHKTAFVPGDPYQSAFNEGMREVVLLIQRAIRQAHELSLSATDSLSYTEEVSNA